MKNFSEYSVMVVDDSALQRLYALDLLASLGITRTLQGCDGRNALTVLAGAAYKPDILITDLEMPGMDGVDLIRHIAEQKLASALIVVSSRESSLLSSVEIMANEHGLAVLGVAEKPLSCDSLAALIARFQLTSPSSAKQNIERHFSKDEIINAVMSNQLLIHYQPKVTAHSGVMRGVEALVRWKHPQFGLIGPQHFIPDAENFGVIDLLTEWVINVSLAQLRQWHTRGLSISLAINLSPSSLSEPDLADRIAVMAKSFAIEPKYLVLEITESAVMSNLALSLGTLARFRLKGFGLSIDDFGSGFSSMLQLSRIPFTEMKIDRSLVNGAAEKQHLHVLLQSTVEMGKRLQLSTVAEGVEKAADWELMRQLGCDIVQGYYVSKPMPADALAGWIKHGTKHLRAS